MSKARGLHREHRGGGRVDAAERGRIEGTHLRARPGVGDGISVCVKCAMRIVMGGR